MHRLIYIILYAIAASVSLAFVGCGQGTPPEGEAVKNREKIPAIVTRGISQVISDSGFTRYRLISEECAIFDQTDPPRKEFLKGILLLRYNNKMNIDMQITADTAILFDSKLMELRGNVYVNNEEKLLTYTSQQLFYDMEKAEFYSDAWTHIVTPDREIQGTRFRASNQTGPDGKMPRFYEFDQDKGSMPMPEDQKDEKKPQKEAENDNTAATTAP